VCGAQPRRCRRPQGGSPQPTRSVNGAHDGPRFVAAAPGKDNVVGPRRLGPGAASPNACPQRRLVTGVARYGGRPIIGMALLAAATDTEAARPSKSWHGGCSRRPGLRAEAGPSVPGSGQAPIAEAGPMRRPRPRSPASPSRATATVAVSNGGQPQQGQRPARVAAFGIGQRHDHATDGAAAPPDGSLRSSSVAVGLQSERWSSWSQCSLPWTRRKLIWG
jgi:hypothetical protein